MLSTLKNYVNDSKATVAKTAGFVGGIYITKRYITNRLDEVKARLEQERAARESLRRRFQQTQDDVAFTVLALLPTLGDQILGNMDVEAITRELQTKSKARNTRQPSATTSLGIGSSIHIVQEHEVRSENGSVSTTFSLTEPPESSAQTGGGPNVAQTNGQTPEPVQDPLSSSFITSSTHDSGGLSVHSSQLSDNLLSSSMLSESSDTRTKAELWNEVKMLTFTRTLTTLYSTTLLCLLTTIQLTLLARAKYVHSVLQQERDERVSERLEFELSLGNLLFGNGKGLESLMSRDLEAFLGEEDTIGDEALPADVENKYLTISWWLLHVGWKDVGERVRRGVEEVFEGVSLKTKLSVMDLHRLVSDIRRRVEHEITFEGTERRINFLSTLLPPTPEMVQHVLTQGGFPTTNHSNVPSSSGSPPAASGSLSEKHTQESSSASLSSSQLSHSNYFLSALNNTADPFPSFIQQTGAPGLSNALILPTHDHPHLQSQSLPIPNPLPHTADVPFTSLLEETRTVICSSDFALTLENCLDRAMEVLFDGLTENSMFVDSTVAAGEEVRIRLAGLLPGLSNWSSSALRGVPCQLADNVLAVREVPCLSAIVFAKFEDRFQ